MFFYVNATNYHYARASQTPLETENLLQVPFPPLNGLSRWSPQQQIYVPLTAAEVGEPLSEDEPASSGGSALEDWSFFVCYNSSSVRDTWLRRQNGTSTWEAPYTIKKDCQIYDLTLECDDNDAWYLELWRNKKFYQRLLKPQGQPSVILEGVNIPLARYDRLSLRCSVENKSKRIRYPGAGFYLREL